MKATDFTLDQLKNLYDKSDYDNPNIMEMVNANHTLELIGFYNEEGEIIVGWNTLEYENYIWPQILYDLEKWVEKERM